ncbi:YciI family protein [Actinokineospora auranticolor]|uniref:YCII-related domain-containing protein n=1 Tax=Actinokineospora auranticolor TaxID=155976 RepID=A0A2S6GJY0_9PSEU|nr:YciI family protein [Actinokineospora auranticolor]PPK65461.1 hypothetical protein CLV40_114113 [Actinokineospora auranticolor]
MRYIVLLNAEHPDTPPPAELMAGIVALGEEATRSGVLLDTAGLAPSAEGSRLTVRAGELSAVDGPFAETRELISYAIYEVATKAEVEEWTNRFLRLHRDLWPGWQGAASIHRVLDFGPPA